MNKSQKVSQNVGSLLKPKNPVTNTSPASPVPAPTSTPAPSPTAASSSSSSFQPAPNKFTWSPTDVTVNSTTDDVPVRNSMGTSASQYDVSTGDYMDQTE